jgi:hypothetical protein
MISGSLLSRRNPDHVSIVRSVLADVAGHRSSYRKYVLRKFHSARIYYCDTEVVGISVWKIVNRDISKHVQVDPYIQLLVMSTKHFDLNLGYKMVEDICSQSNMSVVIEPNTPEEERFYQYLGFLIVSVFPSVCMRYQPDV